MKLQLWSKAIKTELAIQGKINFEVLVNFWWWSCALIKVLYRFTKHQFLPQTLHFTIYKIHTNFLSHKVIV